MSIQLSVVNAAASDTFQNWLDKTNAVINTIANSVITANTNANGATTTGNAYITGTVGATILVSNTMRGGNVQSSANLTISSNALITGAVLLVGANVVVNSTSLAVGANALHTDTLSKFGNTSVNAVVNSTALVLSPNATLTGTSLSFGNSSVNAVVNTLGVSISGSPMPLSNNKAAVAVSGTLVGTATRINFIGSGSASVTGTVDVANSQVNVVITASATLANGAGGNNTDVVYNDAGSIAGSDGFTFTKTTNNVLIANTLTVGNGTINSTARFMGNATINVVSNSTSDTFANSTVTSSYALGGFSIGANVVGTPSLISVGNATLNTVANSTSLTSTNLFFNSGLFGGSNVMLTTALLSIGNTTINSVVNSTALVIGSASVNTVALVLGTTLVVNTSFILLGNTTQSYSGNSVQSQLANSTCATIANSNGLAVGSNVSVTFQTITVGASIMNTDAMSAPYYLGAGIAVPTQYWANAAGKVITTDTLNVSGAYQPLTDAATISWDMSQGINFQVTLAGNRTIANPTNVIPGRSGVLRLIQDGTGGRTFSYGANYVFDSDVAPVIGTGASKENYLFYHCVTTTRILITLAAKSV